MKTIWSAVRERPLGLLLFGLTLAAWTPIPAQTPPAAGVVAGTVKTVDGTPVADAQVQVTALRRRAAVGADGSFRLDGLPAGSYLLEAVSPRYGNVVQRVTVAAGETAEVGLRLDLSIHRDEIVVTAGPDPRSQSELAQATTVIEGETLRERLAPTLGETLNREPGVSSTFFGPGASRPVIRGLGGDRIRILESGIGTGDASTTSPDHAVSTDPMSAERIEIVRGPATLLYGSSAVGGVVNLIDSRIPSYLPEEPVTGTFDGVFGSAAGERSGHAALQGGLGPFAWHLDGMKRKTGDYDSPLGQVRNSASDTGGWSGGVSYVGKSGYLGVATTRFDTLYGSPAEEEVKIDLQQRRFDLQGELNQDLGFLRGLKVRFGQTDYEHVELEGDEVGTRFLNDSWEGRLEAVQQPFGPLSGSFGLQLGKRDFRALGEEAFVPPTRTDSRAAFTFQELSRGEFRYQAGLRYESQKVEATLEDGTGDVDKSGVSGSLGLVWLPGDDYAVSLALSRSVKLPNAEELFSNGPHIATDAFEIGDPDLKAETNLGAELAFRKRTGRLTGEVSLFENRFDGFIFEQLTGEEEDGLQVLRFAQRDARFRGGEISGLYEIYHAEPHHVDAEFGFDSVQAELRDTGEPLPRIPPRRYRLALHYRGENLDGSVEGVRLDGQDRAGAFETPTEGATLLNATLGYRFITPGAVVGVLLRGTNLTDELARNHVSFLKDVAPLPGRDVSLSLQLSF